MAANNIYIQVDLNSQSAQQNVNALNNAIASTGPVAEKSSKQATKALTGFQINIQQTTKAFGELTTAVAGLGIARMASNVIQVGSELNRAQTMMKAFTGSAEEAEKVFEQIRAVAQQSTFHFKDLEEAGQALLGFGMAAKDVPATLKIITDEATAMGGSIENVNAIVRLFGRVMDKEFVGAMDLMRLLPQQGVKVGEALQKALGVKDMQAVTEELKTGALNYKEVINVILQAMREQTAGAGARIQDVAKILKNFEDAINDVKKAIMAPEGFGTALDKLAKEMADLLAPVAGVVDELLKLPEPTKEMIVNVTAATAAVVALSGAFALLNAVAGPAITAITALGGAIAKALVITLTNPELLLALATITGAVVLFANQFPEEAKKIEDKATGWVTDLWKKMQEKLVGLSKEGQGFLQSLLHIDPLSAGTGQITQETDTNLENMRKKVQEWVDSSKRAVFDALGAPADAVKVKYDDLFSKLEDDVKKFHLTAAHAQELRDQLTTAKDLETKAKGFEVEKKHIEELGKLDAERVKGSYEAQIAYIEALDTKDLRGKVAAIDHITDLRIASAQKVAQVENDTLQQIFDARKAILETMGPEGAKAIADLQRELGDKIKLNNEKAFDDEQKYRLEGWKKANDAIIEDQKRVFDAFKSEFDQLFDAFTSKSPGKAIGQYFRNLAMGEARNLFSSTAASAATAAAGYGVPSPEITRGGILGQLFQRGMPPRPPGAPPDLYNPGHGQAGVNFDNVQSGANRFMIGADTILDASKVFAGAAHQLATTAGSSKGYAERRMSDAQLVGPEPHITLGPMQAPIAPPDYPAPQIPILPPDFPAFMAPASNEPPVAGLPQGGGGFRLPIGWGIPNISAPTGGGGGFPGFGTGTVAGPGGFNYGQLVANWKQMLGYGAVHGQTPGAESLARAGSLGAFSWSGFAHSPFAKAGAGLIGGMLAQRGLLGADMGTGAGIFEGTLGGAGLGFSMGGPLGAGIGAAAGLGISIGEMLAGVESPRRQAQRLANQLYHIAINATTADQIVALANSSYGGSVQRAMRSPEVRHMLGLFAAGTGQSFAQGFNEPHGASLVESGGQLMQQATYQYGNPYVQSSGLPTFGGVNAQTLGAPGGLSLSLNIGGQDAAKFMTGQVVTPDVVQTQYASAMSGSSGRVAQALMMSEPGSIAS